MVSIVSSVDAYKKVLFHCFKHPTQPVSGFLLGRRVPETSADAYFIADAVPLFHTLQMTSPHPMLEVALMQVSAYARTKGLLLLGYYAANERLADNSISRNTELVLDRLEKHVTSGSTGGGSIGVVVSWQVDNRLVVPHGKAVCVTQSVSNTASSGRKSVRNEMAMCFGTWNSDTLTAETSVTESEALEVVGNDVDAFKHCHLVDFDEHLEDVRLNYLQN